MLRRAAEAALRTGEDEPAIRLAHDVLSRIDEHDDPVAEALAHERLGRYLWTTGRDQEAMREYHRAVELIPAGPPSEERAVVLAGEAQALMLLGHTSDSNARCQEALEVARAVGADSVEANVLSTMSAEPHRDRQLRGRRECCEGGARIARPERLWSSYIAATSTAARALTAAVAWTSRSRWRSRGSSSHASSAPTGTGAISCARRSPPA